MSKSEAKKQILELLEQDNFLTVKQLAEQLYVSESGIRRYLAELQAAGLVHRTHGGATAIGSSDRIPHLSSRMVQNASGKRKIAKKAAELLKDGQIVMLDGSSTASFLVPYIAHRKNITLFTNNMETALRAIAFGIETHCIGGKSVSQSAALSGEGAYRYVSELHPDILFFSSHNIDDDGIISDPCGEENHLRELMIKNAEYSVFLCDSEKFSSRSLYRLASLDDVDCAVFDTDTPSFKARCRII